MAKSKKRKRTSAAGVGAGPAAGGPTGGARGMVRGTATTVVGAGLALAAVVWLIFASGPEDATIRVIVPALSPAAEAGKAAFDRVCAKCHGDNVGGSKIGPPLIDPFYAPGHHGDGAFRSAIASGVRQHHWKFGAMPPQPGVEGREIADLITYIREMQRANGVL